MTSAALPRLSARVLVGIPAAVVVVSGLAVQAVFVAAGVYPFRWIDVAASLGNALVYVLVMWPAAVATFRWTMRRWPLRDAADVARHAAVQVGVAVLGFVLAAGLLRLMGGYVMPVQSYLIIAAVAAVSTAFLATVLYGALAAQRLREAAAAATAAELRALRAQIQPHFLFNTLNTIAALVRLRPEAAERVTEDLADLLRYSLAASEHPRVSLAEEIASVRLFLGIEQARYGDALTVEIDVPDALLRAPVPSLLLQPLAENAVHHGVRQADGRGTVRVSARAEPPDVLVLRVEDSGAGFPAGGLEAVLGRGTGLTNVAERVRVETDGRGTLAVDPDAPGGAVVVRLPLDP